MKDMSVLRRVTGTGIAGSLALALLAGGCVLAATAGPREAQATGLLGVQQMMDGLSPVDKTLVVSSSSATINGDLNAAAGNAGGQAILAPSNLDDVTAQLRRDFGSGPLPLAPRSADWASMTPELYPCSARCPSFRGPPRSWRWPTGTRSPPTCGW
jgi:hypothetical protein